MFYGVVRFGGLCGLRLGGSLCSELGLLFLRPAGLAALEGGPCHQQAGKPDQYHRPQVNHHQDKIFGPIHKAAPAAGNGFHKLFAKGGGGGGQYPHFLQGNIHGGIAHLVIHQPHLAGVAFQLILHIRKLAFNFQQVGGGFSFVGQGVQPVTLVVQGFQAGFHIYILSGNVLRALVQRGHVPGFPGGGQKAAVVFGGDARGVISIAAAGILAAALVSAFQVAVRGGYGLLQGCAGGIIVGGFHPHAGVIHDLAAAFHRGRIQHRAGQIV